MRRRQILAQLNPRDNRAPVPSGAGMGAAAVDPNQPSPVSRAEEEAKALIWPLAVDADGNVTVNAHRHAVRSMSVEINLDQFMTPGTDPEAAPLVKKVRGWPKGKKRGPKHAR
jgi:hypothetical protein